MIFRYLYKSNVSVSNQYDTRIDIRHCTDAFRVQIYYTILTKLIISYNFFNVLTSKYKKIQERSVNKTLLLIQKKKFKKIKIVVSIFMS